MGFQKCVGGGAKKCGGGGGKQCEDTPPDWTGPPFVGCGDETNETAVSLFCDLTGPYNVAGCFGTLTYVDALSSQPTTFTGPPTATTEAEASGDIIVSTSVGGTNVALRHVSTNIQLLNVAGCEHYLMQLVFNKLSDDAGLIVYYIGPKVNGPGSARGIYTWYRDSTSSTLDANGFDIGPVYGCSHGNVPPTRTVF